MRKKSKSTHGAAKKSRSMSARAGRAHRPVITAVRGIGRLYTLEGAAAKSGRRCVSADLSPVASAAMIIVDGRIEWIGAEKNLSRKLARRAVRFEHDFRGASVIPALVECHTHLVYAGNRAAEFERRNQGESYQSIAKSGGGILSTVRQTREASEAELARLAQARADRFLQQGVATIEIKSGYALDVEGELKMLRAAGRVKGARIIRTFLGAHAIPPEARSAEAYLESLINEALPRVKEEGLACRVDIFVEDGFFNASVARRYLQAAKNLGFDLAVHADQLTRSGGAELACELGARSAEHLILIDSDDIRRLAASEVICVLLPTADLYMKCAYPPARALIDAGARVALATDFNPGTAPSQDVALAGVLARLQMKMSLPEVITAYTFNAAAALGLERELGSLTIGKRADFAVLKGDLDEIFLTAGEQPIAHLFRDGQKLF